MSKQELLELRKRTLVAPADLMEMMQGDSPPSILAVQSVCPYTGKDSQCGRWLPGAVDAEAYSDFAARATAASGDRPLPDIDSSAKGGPFLGVVPWPDRCALRQGPRLDRRERMVGAEMGRSR